MFFKRKNLLVLILCMLTLIFTSCVKTAPVTPPAAEPTKGQPISKSDFLLGTIVEISIYDKQDEAIIDKALDRIREIENKMTINNAETSEIIALNEAAGTKEVKVSADTLDVLERGMYYSELSKGRFDITVGPIVKLWNIGTDLAAVPDPKVLEEKVKLIDYRKLHVDRNNLTAKLDDPDMQVDLGAIAKGYAADEVAEILKQNGVQHAIINLGGNVLTIGGNMQDSPWKIGIQDPFNPRGDFLGIASIKDKTVVTSGTYERYFEQDGKRYHHILDPRTGYPADNEVASVSIITDKSMDGDGNSTSVLLLGLEEGMKFIEGQKNIEAIFITYDKKVYITSGLQATFMVTNPDFTLMN
ncbi:MAG: thiamine biosynthesis protein ApbE [Clostridia bacterium]|nr:thiamine biosynthesis protein ApbE [Clostridia bacterium]